VIHDPPAKRAPGALAGSQGLSESQKAELEVANGFRQYDEGIQIIKMYLEPDRQFAFRPSLVQHLQRIAVEGFEPDAGEFRTTSVKISRSAHVPPGPHLVKSLVQEMCDYVNDNLHESTPFHLAAYVMWGINWIHPFSDGNGRTSRIVSYVVLSVKLGYLLPGAPSIPQQIQEDRSAYFRALERADEAYKSGAIDVSGIEDALKGMLAAQLLSVIEMADRGPQAI
jgi:Fic family protein